MDEEVAIILESFIPAGELLPGDNGSRARWDAAADELLAPTAAEEQAPPPPTPEAADAAADAAAARAAEAYLAALRGRVAAAVAGGPEGARKVLAAGIRCLDDFVRVNATGPMQLPLPPLWQACLPAPAAPAPAAPALGRDCGAADERWAAARLQVDGEDLVGRVAALDRLLAALACLSEPLGLPTTAEHGRGGGRRGGGGGSSGGVGANGDAAGADADVAAATAAPKRQLPIKPPGGLASWPWWAARALLLHQQVLSGRSVTVQTALLACSAAAVEWADGLLQGGSSSGAGQPAGAAAMLAAAARLEAARAQHAYGDAAAAQRHLDAAAAALGVEVFVTGALGRRTAHQLDAKAQLVAGVVADSKQQQQQQDGVGAEFDLPVAELGLDAGPTTRDVEGMQDESDVLAAPALEPASGDGAAAAGRRALSGVEQALLLACAAQVKRGSSADDLQQWEMAPYVEAVLGQPRSQFALQAAARLLKARHERTRGRTRERALLALEQLCGSLLGGDAAAAAAAAAADASSSPSQTAAAAAAATARRRRPYAHAADLPLWPLLRKELAETHIAMGFVGPAMAIYEELAMWDHLVVCYQLLGKKQAALEVVRARLERAPDDAKLWCALGDVTGDAAHYETAWERSGKRSARAQRALARAALKRKDYAAAAAHFEEALALSPLWPDAWFGLGYCCMRTENAPRARQAFTALTQLEPDHGEAWANLAALWLQARQWPQALSASEQAVRHKRDSWQAWENYGVAALHARALAAASRGAAQVLALSGGQRVPMSLLEGLVAALEEGPAAVAGAEASAADDGGGDDEEEEAGEAMEAPDELLGLLKLAAASKGDGDKAADASAAAATSATAAAERAHAQASATAGAALKAAANAPGAPPAVWGLLGRWYASRGEAASAKEAALKHVRALQGAPFARERAAFEAMAAASVAMADAYIRLAAADGSSSTSTSSSSIRDLAAARMHLRGVVRQAEAAFGDDPLFGRLKSKLSEVEAAEAAAKAAAVAVGPQ